MQSETEKLPKGQRYTLKPTALQRVLTAAKIDIDTHLIRAPGTLSYAYFWPPNPNVPYERLYIRTGSVSVGEVAAARQRMEAVTLPALVKWIGDILALDQKSPIRREQQCFDF